MLNIFSSLIHDVHCYPPWVSFSLLFYTHIPTAIISLIAGSFLLIKNKKLETKIFFFLSLTFFLFSFGDLMEWFAFLGKNYVWFFRSIIELADPALFVLSSYFLYVLVKKKDARLIYKIIWLLPVVIYAGILSYSYSRNLIGYNWDICEVVEGSLVATYGFYMDLFYLVSALIFAIWSIIKAKGIRKEVSIISAGVGSFMILFFVMEYVFTGYILGGVFDYNYFLYALFGMPILIIFLSYLTVKYNLFKTKLITVQIIIAGAFAIIFAQYFFIYGTVSIVLNTVALFGMAVLGNIMIKNVKKEIKQKEELAKLNIDLQDLIKQRESLMHLVTHKVKGSFTRSKYIFAGLLDGTFGGLTPEIKKIAEQGLESDNMGIETVDLVLNAANMQKGLIKYDMKPLNFKDIVEKSISDKKISAEAKGLKIEETEIKDGTYDVLGDSNWLKESVNNLIENSIKYTREGTINVGLEKKPASTQGGDDKILLSVKDTGVGITEEDKKNLFTEGGRGKDSVKVNVDSTGYGLYTVKLVVEAHKGRVWVESEGAGKGSQFYIELPILKV